jgi:hypothetical protein
MLIGLTMPSLLRAGALSGTYTVCSSGCNYSSLKAAVADLTANGVSGAVTFTLKVQDYSSDPIRIQSSISGISSTNTVTFQGAAGSGTAVSKVTVSKDTALLLKGASYINFKSIEFVNTGTPGSNNYYAAFINSSNYINFTSCSFIAQTGSFSAYNTYVTSSSYITFDKSYFHGGYANIYFNGTSNSTISNSNLMNGYNYCLFMYNGSDNTASSNALDSLGYSSGYTLYSEYETGATINANNIHGGGYFLIELYAPNSGSTTDPYIFSNNMISSSNSSTYDLLYIDDGYNSTSGVNVKVAHNSFYGDNTHCTSIELANWGGTHGYEFLNNLFIGTANVSDALFYIDNSLDGYSGDQESGNDFYTSGSGPLLYANGTTIYKISNWLTAAAAKNLGKLDQSVSISFKNVPYDLHLTSSSSAPWGAYAGIAKDYDGDARCTIAPTSGADEASANATKPVSSWTQYPSSSVSYYDGYPATFKNNNKATDPLIFRWYVNGKKVSDSIDLVTQDLTAPSSTVTLVTVGCGGKDSVTKTYTVKTPAGKPITDFISNYNTILEGNSVKFSDLSQNYPNKFSWEVFPKTALVNGVKVKTYTYVSGDSTKANPIIQFNAPGKYQICLTTSNSLGKGTTECKVDYINVIGAYLVNSSYTITDQTGYLYDDGGINGAHAYQLATYTVTIAPSCAKAVHMVFTDFDLYCYGDMVRIYDGTKITSSNEISKCSTGMTGGPSYPGTCSSTPSCIPNFAGKSNTDTFTATSGVMTFVFNEYYNFYNFRGFAAYWWTDLKVTAPPKASFTAPDTVCTNANVPFTNTSTGSNLTYQWYFQGDLRNPDDQQKNSSWPFLFTGPQTIYLVTTNCSGTDTAVKTIFVKNPPKPKANFHADNTNPTTSDVVYLIPDIPVCVDDYKWTITKKYGISKITFVNGTNIYSAVPAIVLSDTGCYDVKLVVDNAAGTDSIAKSCHIFVKQPYCVPTVLNQIADLGISNVTVSSTGQGASILFSNNSAQTATYENYTPTVSANMEIGVSYTVSITRQTSANAQVRTIYIDWNQDGDFLDAGETVASDAPGRKATWIDTLTVPAYAKTGATVMRIAANQGTQSNDPCLNIYGEYEDYRLYISNDRTPPVITLKGADTIRIEQGYTFADPGATAYDNLSGDLTVKITVDKFDITHSKPGFNILVPGTYRFTYNVSDDAGNAAKPRTRIVIVTPDKTKPDLEVNSDSVVIVGVNTSFTYPDARATDLVDGILDASILVDTVPGRGHFYYPSVNINKVDTFPVTYEVSDISGNLAYKTIMVIVADTTKPVLSIGGVHGAGTVYVDAGSDYKDMGVAWADNYYNSSDPYPVDGMSAEAWMNAHVTVTSNVNTHKLGTYTVTYTLCDPSGNCATPLVRTVIVQDTTAPVVTIVGGNPVTLEVKTHYNDPGVQAVDNFTGTTTDVSGTFYSTFANGTPDQLGTYTIVYTVTDSVGNRTIVTRTIKVIDDIAPVITLNGDLTVNLCRWSDYKDAGYSVTDNFWTTKDSGITVKQMGTFKNTQVPGLYSLYYVATDKSGNSTTSQVRAILVRYEDDSYCTTGINNGSDLSKAITIYPNPSTGLFTVSTNLSSAKNARIVVTNMLGQDVATVNNQAMGQGQFNLDLRSQAAGVYLVNIYTENEVVVKRIVISK